jgi:enoyl-CoA hydratase/carnithine racemase
MEYATLRYAAGPVARVTLNRPDKRNPIGPVTCGELVHAFRAARDDAAVRVIVLTGAGTMFSAGGDLSAMAGGAGGPTSAVASASLVELFLAMHALGKPIVAMVNGHAFGGGTGLVAACDVAFASDAAQFGLTEINLGLWPMMIAAEVTRNVGRKRALELMLSGRKLPAAEAAEIGLVTRVVPAADLERETLAFADALAARSPATLALGLTSFYKSADMAHGDALRYLEGELDRVLALEDAAEGLAAFLAKRAPVWKGR